MAKRKLAFSKVSRASEECIFEFPSRYWNLVEFFRHMIELKIFFPVKLKCQNGEWMDERLLLHCDIDIWPDCNIIITYVFCLVSSSSSEEVGLFTSSFTYITSRCDNVWRSCEAVRSITTYTLCIYLLPKSLFVSNLSKYSYSQVEYKIMLQRGK